MNRRILQVFKKPLIAFLFVCILISNYQNVYCSGANKTNSKSISDFSNATFGCVTGTIHDGLIRNNFPKATMQYYNNYADIVEELKRGRINACTMEISCFNEIYRQNKNCRYVDGSIYTTYQAFPFSKKFANYENGLVLKQLNEFIKESNENGFVKELDEKWVSGDSDSAEFEPIKIENPQIVLNVTSSIQPPYSFLKNNIPVGLDVEFLNAFCKKYNYSINIDYCDFSASLAGVATDKYDIMIGGITITDERKQSVIFSDSYYQEDVVVVYYEEEKAATFVEYVKNSFYNSMIKENRYLYILEGLLTTLIITFSSVVIGIIIGLILYLIYRKSGKVIQTLLNLYSALIKGLPFLVLLLVMYYIIFGKASTPSIVVAIITFIITFSLYIFETLNSYVGLIDKGQVEASYALGFSDKETFWFVLMPQAIINMLPDFKTQVISLLKNTSIVGYIAVFDLTRAGDIIRSRTYEAFFPILSVAIIYFILGIVFKVLLNLLQKALDPYNRNKLQIKKEITNG